MRRTGPDLHHDKIILTRALRQQWRYGRFNVSDRAAIARAWLLPSLLVAVLLLPGQRRERVSFYHRECIVRTGRKSCAARSSISQCLKTCIYKKETMPTYHVEMMEGRTVEQKTRLVAEITRVSVEILGGEAASVDIIITDIKPGNWATGGKLWSAPRD